MADNRTVSPVECEAIRSLSDFDMTMLISEIHDHGWPHARPILRLMPDVSDKFDDLREVQKQAARAEREPIKQKSMPARAMIESILAQGCIPLMMIGGKEIGAGFRDYVVAAHQELGKDGIIYILRRLLGLMDGTHNRQVESN